MNLARLRTFFYTSRWLNGVHYDRIWALLLKLLGKKFTLEELEIGAGSLVELLVAENLLPPSSIVKDKLDGVDDNA
jgi:hypothetical protein